MFRSVSETLRPQERMDLCVAIVDECGIGVGSTMSILLAVEMAVNRS